MTKTDKPKSGYANPPTHKQFRKGQSGNQRGRPKGSKNKKTILRDIAREKHIIPGKDGPIELTTMELVVMALRQAAMEGDIRAIDKLDEYQKKYRTGNTKTLTIGLVAPEDMPQEEWIAKQRELNKTRERPNLMETLMKQGKIDWDQ